MPKNDDAAPAGSLAERLRQRFGHSSDEKSRFKGPVGWMLDRQLTASLHNVFFYDAFGSQIDPRNWMTGNEVDRTEDFSGSAYWFDYLSDSGDGMRATYSIAYLVQSDLFVAERAKAGAQVGFEEDDGHSCRLPRGDFLFVGGDTSYHVADFETLTERFQTPFRMAYQDLDESGRISEPKRRPILGIPGNHDYYDFLDGFNRQFRRPYSPEPNLGNEDPEAPPLALMGFARRQTASFLSIKLPFGWRMWGMDAHEGKLDRRQKNFFQTIAGPHDTPPKKLIVATPDPLVAFGKRQRADGSYAKTFEDLGLPPQFVDTPKPAAGLPPGHCRLDLSGDVHHYARYGGAAPDAPVPANHASVVSGLGGAFLHPSSTDVGEVPSEVRYPSPRTSLQEILKALLKPWTVVRGGRLWLMGMVVAGLIYVGIACSPSIRSALEPVLAHVGIETPRLAGSTGRAEAADPIAQSLSTLKDSLLVPRKVDRQPGLDSCVHCGKNATEVGHGLLHRELAFIPLLLAVLFIGLWRYKVLRRRVAADAAARQRNAAGDRDNVVCAAADASVWSADLHNPIRLLAVAAIAIVVWVYTPGDYAYGVFHPLASSFVLLTMLAATYLAFRWCNAYDEALNRKSRRFGSPTFADHAHGWLLWTITVLIPIFGVARYGVDSLAVMAIDMGFLLIVIGMLFGLPLFAMTVGGKLHGLAGKIGFLFLGLWHALLQFCFPLLIVLAQPAWVGLAAMLVTAAVAWSLSRLLPLLVRSEDAGERRRIGFVLLVLWLLWSGAMVALAFESPAQQAATWASLVTVLVLGGTLSCIWFGWYLAVAICLDGHNNEAGGGSRIENYKQFIRFRLTEESLTGYVIAVDRVGTDGAELRPKLIDVFEIKPR